MHPILEQIKSVMYHLEAFEEETLRRFELKLVRHGRDMGNANEECLYSFTDAESEDFGCRTMVSDAEAWFEVFYEDNNESGDRAYSLVLEFHPKTHEYALEMMVKPEGLDEVLAVLGKGWDVQDGKSQITADQYAFLGACMACRYAERRAR